MKIKIFRILKSEAIPFISTLTATLIGVFIAVVLTNNVQQNKEVSDCAKLLRSAESIAQESYNQAYLLDAALANLSKDSTNYSQNDISRLRKSNPLPSLDLLKSIFSNEIVSKNLSEFSHNKVYSILFNLEKFASANNPGFYKKEMEKLVKLISLEIELQQGELSLKQLELKYNPGD